VHGNYYEYTAEGGREAAKLLFSLMIFQGQARRNKLLRNIAEIVRTIKTT
jgi:hypothetical protein